MLRTADKRLFLGPLGGVVPKSIDWGNVLPPVPGYDAWFDASDESTMTLVSGTVSEWADKTGSYDAVQTTASNRPRYGGRRIGPHRVVEFDGTNDHLLSSLPSDDRTCTRFVVAQVDNLSQFHTLLGSQGGTGGIQIRVNQTSGLVICNKSGISGIGQLDAVAVTPEEPFLVVLALTATDCTLALDGVSETDANSDALTAGRTTYIGRGNPTNTEYPMGLMGEILSYPTTLTPDEIVLTSHYLRQKWGTPIP